MKIVAVDPEESVAALGPDQESVAGFGLVRESDSGNSRMPIGPSALAGSFQASVVPDCT